MKMVRVNNSRFTLGAQRATPKRQASVGEKALYLMNNKKAWEQLKKELRASGVTTNFAAQHMIIEYLQNMPEPNEEVQKQMEEFEEANRNRSLSEKSLISGIMYGLEHLTRRRVEIARSA